MARFTALTSRGLGKVLETELRQKSFKVIKVVLDSVVFDASWKDLYRAHLELKSATRVIMPILDFNAYDADELYCNVLKHDFTKYIKPSQHLSVNTKLSESLPFNNGHFVSQKVKDAIVDQFNKKYDKRPSVDSKDPALKIINKWGDKKSEYLFGFYTADMDANKKLAVSKQQIKNINKYVKRIADELEFEVTPTFMFARHSYSTISLKLGASIEYISEALGHTNIKTTRNYIDSFEETKVKEHNSKLLNPTKRPNLKII